MQQVFDISFSGDCINLWGPYQLPPSPLCFHIYSLNMRIRIYQVLISTCLVLVKHFACHAENSESLMTCLKQVFENCKRFRLSLLFPFFSF